MIYAIVPVKLLALAKGRLAGVLSAAERRSLALAMLGDVLAALNAARGVDSVTVISRDPAALGLAAARGATALIDQAADLNGALAQAGDEAAARGARALLVLPADLPLVTAEEIERVIGALDGPGVVLAPSRDGGTNALLLRPPLAIPFLFGVGSMERHLAAARARGLTTRIVRSPGLERDIDTPADLSPLRAGTTGEARSLALGFNLGARTGCVCEI